MHANSLPSLATPSKNILVSTRNNAIRDAIITGSLTAAFLRRQQIQQELCSWRMILLVPFFAVAISRPRSPPARCDRQCLMKKTQVRHASTAWLDTKKLSKLSYQTAKLLIALSAKSGRIRSSRATTSYLSFGALCDQCLWRVIAIAKGASQKVSKLVLTEACEFEREPKLVPSLFRTG